MGISVIYSNGAFYAVGEVKKSLFNEMKNAGWKFNTRDGLFTTNLKSASLLRDHADDRAKKIIERAFIRFTPWQGALTPPKGLSFLPFQSGAARFSLSRSRSCLALSPGLGKTIVAAIIARAMGVRTLIVCPPFLTLNTLEEFEKWAPNLHSKILDNVDWVVPDVLIVPDSQVANPYVRSYIRMFRPELFIGDEWHRFKTDTAQRSKAVYGFRDNRRKVKYVPGILDGKHLQKIVLMSGTIMPNRPMELFPMLSKCAGEYINFMKKEAFGMRYCAGFPVKDEWSGKVFGYDFTGCDEKEFKRLMKCVKTDVLIHKENKTIVTNNFSGFMLRLNKSILGLPKLTEEIVVLGEDMPKTLKGMDAEMLRKYSPKDLIKLRMKQLMGQADSEEDIHLMTYRRMLGEYKVKPACEFIKSILEETEENHLVVAIHKEVVRAVEERLSAFNPMVITGDTPSMKRQRIVKEYQNSKNRRVMLGNLDAIGIGFTMTKVHRIPLIEYDWSPGKNRQVIDRAHRYGLKHELLAQYLCFRNSLDRRTIETLLYKEKITAYV
jgi:SWI/SNF-related matrix-associated actin-dependent regulator 1 of chromatin subfamily A